jgi:hypothetical protein
MKRNCRAERKRREENREREKGGGGILKNFVKKHSVTYLHTHSPILFSLAASCCCSSYFFQADHLRTTTLNEFLGSSEAATKMKKRNVRSSFCPSKFKVKSVVVLRAKRRERTFFW